MAKSVDDGGVWFALQNSGGAGRDPGRDEQADHFTLRNARGERANCTAIAVVLVKFLDLDHVITEDAVGRPHRPWLAGAKSRTSSISAAASPRRAARALAASTKARLPRGPAPKRTSCFLSGWRRVSQPRRAASKAHTTDEIEPATKPGKAGMRRPRERSTWPIHGEPSVVAFIC